VIEEGSSLILGKVGLGAEVAVIEERSSLILGKVGLGAEVAVIEERSSLILGKASPLTLRDLRASGVRYKK
jgi:hypothetical protein